VLVTTNRVHSHLVAQAKRPKLFKDIISQDTPSPRKELTS
jgi:hypothetical protein